MDVKTEGRPGQSGTEEAGRRGKKGAYMMKLNNIMSFSSYFIFFLCVCFISVVNLLLYRAIARVVGDFRHDWWAVVAVAANVMFVSALVCVIDGMRRRFTIEAPLRRILDGLAHISQGEYGYQIEPPYTSRINEFDDIIDSINELSKELANTETLKTDFVANVTHELKTPLAIILNHAGLLQNADLTDGERREYLETLVNASRRLNGLVVNMLKLNKLEKQNIYPERERFNVGEQFRNVFLSFEGAWSDKDLEIDVDVDDVMLEGDAGLLEIVWSNLVSNAIKFTPKGGSLRLVLKDEGEMAVASVIDGGCGMDAATGKHMFDKFYQGEASHAKEGNGLGLAMVKRVIDIVDGEIRVDSQVGEGTNFTVRIPKNLKEKEGTEKGGGR
ncbi:MAG: HAMP domain-containing histidine kinase [Ruminococcus sp.]|nr:HAMP domain-containing histidine kinase [Ruminococcus sp.]